jgi:hypothetical protein
VNRRWLLFPVGAGLAWAGVYMAAHPYGDRFAIGLWPVPPGTPWSYQLWSGFLPALTVLSLFGAGIGAYHLHNCHFETCWRLGKHRIGGTPWCSRHMHLGKQVRSVEELLEQILAAVSKDPPARRWSRT